MASYLFIVEGKADSKFVLDCVCNLLNVQDLKSKVERKGKTTTLINEDHTIKIFELNGYTNYDNFNIMFKEHLLTGFRLLLIQDADNPQKNHGGFLNRKTYLDNITKKRKLIVDIYLFPDNENDGDLESLLFSSVQKSRYEPFNEAFTYYLKNLKDINFETFEGELNEDKNKLYCYCQVYSGMESAKELNRDYNHDKWDLTSDKMLKFLSFIRTVIN